MKLRVKCTFRKSTAVNCITEPLPPPRSAVMRYERTHIIFADHEYLLVRERRRSDGPTVDPRPPELLDDVLGRRERDVGHLLVLVGRRDEEPLDGREPVEDVEEGAEDLLRLVDAEVQLLEDARDVLDPLGVLLAQEVHHGRVEAVRVEGLELAQQEQGVQAKVEPQPRVALAGPGLGGREPVRYLPREGELVVLQRDLPALRAYVKKNRYGALLGPGRELLPLLVVEARVETGCDDNPRPDHTLPDLQADLRRELAEAGECRGRRSSVWRGER